MVGPWPQHEIATFYREVAAGVGKADGSDAVQVSDTTMLNNDAMPATKYQHSVNDKQNKPING